MKLIIDISKETYNGIKIGMRNRDDMREVGEAIENGTPLQEILGRENSEIKNEIKDLSKRVEALENQIKEDKEEQLKRLKAEIDYAKFRCTL